MFPNGNDRLKQWEEQHRNWPVVRMKGMWRFILRHALEAGISGVILMLFIQWMQNLFSGRHESLFFIFVVPFFIGAQTGWSQWRSSEREYQAEEERRRQLKEQQTDHGKPVPPRVPARSG